MVIRQASKYTLLITSLLACSLWSFVEASGYKHSVKVLHYLLPHWGESRSGLQECGDIACDWTHSEHIKQLKDNLYFTGPRDGIETITLGLYNLHSLWERLRITHPTLCELKTNLTMTETEESKVRYGYLFDQGFHNFDGYSSTSPSAAVQRVYVEAFLNTTFLPMRNFTSLIKGASYVASDCHRHDSANADRDSVVYKIREAGFRIDGLGRCMHTGTGPEGISLPKTRDTRYNLYLKRNTIGHFMFNMAFENSLEPGYVTEKPFDALIAGTVPVYLGDAEHLRSLLPHPKAAIFVHDFQGDYGKLAAYLNYLTTNETAYEEHRAWREHFNVDTHTRSKPLLKETWFCRICKWAVATAENATRHHDTVNAAVPPGDSKYIPSLLHKRTHICPNATAGGQPIKAPPDWENKAVRGAGQKQVYIVQNGALRGVPDADTFFAMGFSFEQVMVVGDKEIEAVWHGDALPRIAS